MTHAPVTTERLSRLLNTAALGCLLVVLVVRPFVAESPFRLNDYPLSPESVGRDPAELTRVTLAVIVLAGAALWSLGQFYRPQGRTRLWPLTVLALLLAGWTFYSTLFSVDRRGALDGWLDQMALIFGCLVMMQLARRQALLVLIMLAALAGTLGAKAIWQVTSEIPDRVAAFKADPEKQLAQANLVPGTPQARMFEKRLTDPSAFGYQGLSNVFAGVVLIPALVALGLGVDKLRLARAQPKLPKGEVSLPLLSGVTTLAMGLLGLTAVALSRSKGGIGSCAIALLVVGVTGKFFMRHRRKALLLCLLMLVLLTAGVTIYGLHRDGLPGRSLQVRWEYWQGAAGIVRDHRTWGIGSDNFGFYFPRYRPVAAAESTKTAHNLFLDAATQYGLPGAGALLILLGAIFALAARPDRSTLAAQGAVAAKSSSHVQEPLPLSSLLRWIAVLSFAVLVARLVYLNLDLTQLFTKEVASAMLLEGVLPAAIFGVFALLAAWAGSWNQAALPTFARIAAVCGLAGFLLHNLVEYTLWVPASASIFWLAAGAAVGPTLRQSDRPRSRPIMLLCFLGCLAAMLLAGQCIWQRAYERRVFSSRVQADIVTQRYADAISALKQATEADPLDTFAPAAAAKVYWAEAINAPANTNALPLAEDYAALALRRQNSSDNALLLARVLFLDESRQDDALAAAAKAVELDPMDVRIRMDYADMLLKAGKNDQCLSQIKIVRDVNNHRPEGSDLLFSPDELRQLDAMESKAGAPSPTTQEAQPKDKP